MGTRLYTASTGLVSQDDAVSKNMEFGFVNNVVVYLEGSGTISGGTILIEEASSASYSGTWSILATVAGTDLTANKGIAVHIDGIFGTLRVRVSSALTGGGTVAATIAAA